MNAPDKCPGCSADLERDWENMYQCGSVMVPVGGNVKAGFEERGSCIRRQRDQLRAQVEQWKAYAERLEDAGDSMAYLIPGIGEADTWREAKETKP